MPDDELESYLAAISPDVDSSRSELTGRFGSAQVFQVRLPALRIEQLRRLAEVQGVPPTSLVLDWVIERLDREDPGFGSAVPRAPIAPRVRQPDPVGPVNPVEQANPVGQPPPGPLGRTGVAPAAPPPGQPSRPPAGRPSRSSVGPLTQPTTRRQHPLGSGPLPPAAAPLPPVAGGLPPAAAALIEPALDPVFYPPNPMPDARPLGDGALGTAAPGPRASSGDFAGPALANLQLPDGPTAEVTDASNASDSAAGTTDEPEGNEPNPVTPIFRAGSELPDPDKRRGPRHRAPEPVTSLLTRRKF
jgi:hypothetical protein